MNTVNLYRLLLLAAVLPLSPMRLAADDAAVAKVVSIGGGVTEVVYLLEAQEHLVGVDTTSQWPKAAKQLPQVGYQRNLSAEGIASLSPDTILATADAGPPEVMSQMNSLGINVHTFPKTYTTEALFKRIETIGQLFDRQGQARAAIEQINNEINTARERIVPDQKPVVVFMLGTGPGSAMVAGNNTAADAMLTLGGAANPFDFEGYKPVSAEALIEAQPKYIAVVEHGGKDSEDTIDNVLNMPGVSLTPAGQQRNIVVFDALKFLGFGPRLGQALQDLTTAIYPSR
jgi:iron complex transport system substrate-binding protein